MNSLAKSPDEIAAMKEGGQKLGAILDELVVMAEPGVSLMAIEMHAQSLIRASGGTPSFMTVEDYKYATCLCVNEAVVHGIPTDYILEDGDVLTIDVGLLYKGLHTDTAWTKIVHSAKLTVDNAVVKFLQAGETALFAGIAQARAGNHIGHISKALQQAIEGPGYSVVRSLVGHGVGHELHEAPHIPGFLKGPIEKTPVLVEGMTIAIEIIYAMGRGDVVYDRGDGWTIATRDRSLAAVFEHSLVVTSGQPIILTQAKKYGTINN